MISPIEIISIRAVNMMKGIAAVRSRRADSNLKRAAGGTGSFTELGNQRGCNRDFKRSVPENHGKTILGYFPFMLHFLAARAASTFRLRSSLIFFLSRNTFVTTT